MSLAARPILAENNLALATIDLANLPFTIAAVPRLLEAEHVDVKPRCAIHVGNEEHGARIPAVNGLASPGWLCHAVSRLHLAGGTPGFRICA